jgi:hypothetical protein
MKMAVLGTLAGIGIVAAVAGGAGGVGGEPSAPAPTMPSASYRAGDGLIVVPFGMADKGVMLSVIDPQQRMMSVYQLNPTTGKIALKSARNLRWDLQVDYFNNEPPLPQEIRSMIEQINK